MKFAELTGWVEQHPTESIVIGAGGVIAILWLMGAFSGSSSSDSGASNLAAAYYAAEAQQAVVGGQIQQTTLLTAAQTAQTGIQANAAVAINKAQTKAATTINGQNASTTTALGNDQLLATQSSNDAAIATTNSNNAAATAINQSNNNATVLSTIFGSLMPTELAYGHGYADVSAGSLGNFQTYVPGAAPSIAGLISAGYTPSQAATVARQQSGINF